MADLPSTPGNNVNLLSPTAANILVDVVEGSKNRLAVDAALSSIPQTPVEYKFYTLDNAGSTAQNIDGSVTPVEFDFKPGTDETWYVDSLVFFFNDSGNATPSAYGAIASGLTNGTVISVQSNGNTITIGTLQDNRDILLTFHEDIYVPSGGFLNGTNVFSGTIKFTQPFVIKDSTSDYIRVTINDDLTGLNSQKVRVKLWREQ